MSNDPKRFWRIRRYNGRKVEYERCIPYENLTIAEIGEVLKRLASRHLSDDEIVAASLRRFDSEHANFLELGHSEHSNLCSITVGMNPFLEASVLTE